MIQLPQEYTVKGQSDFKYKIVKREGDVVMATTHYREDDDWRNGKKTPGRILNWEVFVVKKYPDRMSPDGKTFIPAKESPPSTSQWGRDSGSYDTLVSAEKYFQQLVKQQQQKAEELINPKPKTAKK